MHADEHQSFWEQALPLKAREPESLPAKVDVIVVGAGIIGITCSYLLLKAGKSVMLLDRGTLCGGETARTTAHLTTQIDCSYRYVDSVHGVHKSQLVYESLQAAILFIEETIASLGIDCDFEKVSAYLQASTEKQNNLLIEEFESAKKAGHVGVELHKGSIFSGIRNATTYLEFPNQAQFHPVKYLQGLLTAVETLGGTVLPFTLVSRINGGPSPSVECDGGRKFEAHNVIIATNSPIGGASLFPFQAAYRTYVIGCGISKGDVPSALYWDMEDPYHYVRVQPLPENRHNDLLLIGGEDHKVGQGDPGTCYEKLYEWGGLNFQNLAKPSFFWSGEIEEPHDGLPYIGSHPVSSNVFISTGASGTGMTIGTMSAFLICDLIHKRPNPWQQLYSPIRFAINSSVDFVKENLNSAGQYLRNVALPGETESNIQNDQGSVVLEGLRKVAIYKQPSGSTCKMSAFCTHLFAEVCWNSAEKSWDCPAHGSRFDRFGKVINGPAQQPLLPLD